MSARAVVIGVGNSFRRDDGVGPAVIAQLQRRHLPGVTLCVADGEPSSMLDAWTGAKLAVVVDAVLTDAPEPGRICRTASPDRLASGAAASTHGLGVPDAVRLGEVLGHLPERLVVLAIEAADLGFGVGLSPAVAAVVPEVAQRVLDELAHPA